ncbi:MAG: APH(3') family aminoglycoside O-phosphotransferase [Hyphomicrobiales bacterium]
MISLPDKFKFWDAENQTIGRSREHVLKLTNSGQTSLFAKFCPLSASNELRAEAARLSWLNKNRLPSARLNETIEHNNCLWMITEALPGVDLAQSKIESKKKVEIVANALLQLHERSTKDCPFDETIDVKLRHAEQNQHDGKVDETDFEDVHIGRTAAALLQDLIRLKPDHKDIVVTHGDASLPNLLASDEEFSGFVDCGKLGISCRYQDLAIASRSIKRNLGEEWVSPFFEAYGIYSPDAELIYYYMLLDEFF